MPKVKLSYHNPTPQAKTDLIDALGRCLSSEETMGQPLVYEYDLQNGSLRVLVIWDRWQKLALEDRTKVILTAYREQAGPRVALASGLTVLEAVMAGFLSFRIIPAVRRRDKVNLERCWEGMKEFGASVLFEDEPRLYFATREEAERGIEVLCRMIPKSEEVWQVIQEAGGLAHRDGLNGKLEAEDI
ncbi:MAG: hypothetical protein VKK80_12665 [Prochlorothrix sp.]|nr:hypothetical protein [Prochlorothrix sp.]